MVPSVSSGDLADARAHLASGCPVSIDGLTNDIVPGARRLRRAVVLAVLALIGGALDVAAGGLDRRLRVDPDTVPWRAIGKLQAVSENFRKTCTGSLVGPALVAERGALPVQPPHQALLSTGLGALSDRLWGRPLRRARGWHRRRDWSGIRSGPVEGDARQRLGVDQAQPGARRG